MKKNFVTRAPGVVGLTLVVLLLLGTFAYAGGQKEAAAKPVTVKMFHFITETPRAKFIDYWLTTYSKQHPNVKFENEMAAVGDFWNLLKAKMSAGDPPDIFSNKPKEHVDLIDAGELMNIKDFPSLKKAHHWGGFTVGDFVAAMPFDSSYVFNGYFYNKDLFKKAGVSVPKTHNQFIDVGKKLQAAGITPIAAGYGTAWLILSDGWADFRAASINDPLLADDVAAGKRKPSDSKVLRESLQRLKERQAFISKDPFGADYNKALAMFANGDTAIIALNSPGISEIRKRNKSLDLGFFASPISNKEEEVVLSVFLDAGWSVSSKTKAKDVIDDAFSFLWTKDMQQKWVNDADAWSLQEGITGNDKVLDDVFAYIKAKKTFDYSEINTFSGAFSTAFRQMWFDFPADKNLDVNTALANFDASVADILKRTKK